MMPFEFHLPTRILFGAGKFAATPEAVVALGATRALIVCDPWAVDAGHAKHLQDMLKAAGVESFVYDKVVPNPTNLLIDEGAAVCEAKHCNVVIGLGGGSSMDAAKGVAIAATHEQKIWPYAIGEAEISARTLPVVAVTTTSGTGSQCTCFSVITNPATKQKPGMGSPYILPKVAVVDPELMLSAPRILTANVGFDVFTHAVESYTSKAASEMSDMFAERAIQLCAKHLPTAYEDGSNVDARGAMALADTYAGIAICHAVVSLGHVIAHVISGHYEDISHGDALFTVYRETLRLNREAMPGKHEWIANQLQPGCDDIVAAFDSFFSQFDFANKLKEKNLSDEQIEAIAEETFTYMKGITELNPREVTVADARAILQNSLR